MDRFCPRASFRHGGACGLCVPSPSDRDDFPDGSDRRPGVATWIRGHWSIENKVHWVRDVTYDEDRSQTRTGTGPQVMAALRNAAIGAPRLTSNKKPGHMRSRS